MGRRAKEFIQSASLEAYEQLPQVVKCAFGNTRTVVRNDKLVGSFKLFILFSDVASFNGISEAADRNQTVDRPIGSDVQGAK